ncbi:hypothetical protein GCM10027347_44720 [Larkinella harenae]
MQKFDHFYRFFTLSENGKEFPTNRLTPAEKYAIMPVLPGDMLQFIVPRVDLAGLDLDFARIDLKNLKTGAVTENAGALRRQDGELCSRIRIGINRAPKPGEIRQFAIMGTAPDPATGEPVKLPVLGTFTGAQTNLNDYVAAIQEHFQNYPYTPVSVDRYGNELLIRAYHGPRFRLGNQPLGIGLGRNRTYNDNSPSVSAQKTGTVVKAAKDSFRVSISTDIEAGNIFKLGAVTYVANSRQTPADVLAGLGVSASGRIEVAPGTVPIHSVQPGAIALNNRNRPTISIVYSSTSGGSDLYDVIIGADIQPGNVFQIAVPGQTNRSYAVAPGDTVATVVNYFANVGGKLSVPAGSQPLLTAVPGSRSITNTNTPGITLTDKVVIPSATVDQYRVYIGTSIRRGNVFILGAKSVTATDDDTTLTIAEKLDYTGHPFTVEVPQNSELTAYAKRGMALSEANIAAVDLIDGSVWMKALPLVCTVSIPKILENGAYQLLLTDKRTEATVAVSNYLQVTDFARDTALLRWGDDFPGSGRSIFGYDYGEPGLMQQVRIPAFLSESRQFQQETLYTGIDSVERRQSARFTQQRTLTTSAQPAVFHRVLSAALKHNLVSINEIPLLCSGEYSESEFIGRRQLLQAQATLTERQSERSMNDFYPLSAELRFALIESISGAEGLLFYLKDSNTTLPISDATRITPGSYELLVRCENESRHLIVYKNDLILNRYELTARMLHRTESLSLLSGERLRLVVLKSIPTEVSEFYNEPLEKGFDAAFNEDFT